MQQLGTRFLASFVLLAAPAAAQDGWSQSTFLTPSVVGPDETFGGPLAISGDTIAVHSGFYDGPITGPGTVFLYERDLGGPEAWGEAALLQPADGAPGDQFGEALALHGDTLVVGSRSSELGVLAGAAYVYERDLGGPGAWSFVTKLLASDGETADRFGTAVAIHGDTIVVGALGAGGNTGAAYVFERDLGGPDAWGEVALLPGPGSQQDALFGTAVSIEAAVLIVGAPGHHNVNGQNAGAVFVHERDSGGLGTWGESSVALASSGQSGDGLGYQVSLSGDTLAAGPPWPGGRNYVLERDLGGPDNWGEARVFQFATAHTLALSGDLLVFGNGFSTNGQVKVYGRDTGGFGAWGLSTTVNSPSIQPLIYFSSSLAIDGATMVVSAPGEGAIPGWDAVFEYTEPVTHVSYCKAGVTTSGCEATLSAIGTASVSLTSGFIVRADDVEASRDGLFFYSFTGQQKVPWGTGTSFKCVAPPVKRAPLMPGTGTPGTCEGSFALDINTYWSTAPSSKLPLPGSTVWLQLWFRDPLVPGNQTTSLSDALLFVLAQ